MGRMRCSSTSKPTSSRISSLQMAARLLSLSIKPAHSSYVKPAQQHEGAGGAGERGHGQRGQVRGGIGRGGR